MERLTGRWPCGLANYPEGNLPDVINRLAQIEDILGDTYDLDRVRGILNICNGKTPNQVEGIFAEWSHYLDFAGKMNAIEDAVDAIYDDGNVNYDRLRELVEADKDGRCVFTKCKIGDTVFVVGKKKIVKARVQEIYPDDMPELIYLVEFECDNSCDGCPFGSWNQSWEGEWECGGEYGDGSLKQSDFGKTWFLTEEAAEAALAKEANNE